MLYTIRDLKDSIRGVTIRVRVLFKNEIRLVKTKDGIEHRILDSRVGDKTGTVILTLWDNDLDKIIEGKVLDIENAYVSKFKGRLILNLGKFGKIEEVDDLFFPNVNEINENPRRKKIF